jgi:hypothetical protein
VRRTDADAMLRHLVIGLAAALAAVSAAMAETRVEQA